MDRMAETASVYLQIKEWLALEQQVKDLQRQLEDAVSSEARATAAAAVADARADKAIADLLAAGGSAGKGTEEVNRLLAAAAELRTGLERELAAERQARQAAEARAAAKPVLVAPVAPVVPAPAPRAPLKIIYTPQYDSAGKLTRIIAAEQTKGA